MDNQNLNEAMAELLPLLKGKANRWAKAGPFTNVAVFPDGTVDANGNDPVEVVKAILAAKLLIKQARSEMAKRAAATRKRRVEQMVYTIAKRLIDQDDMRPAANCRICGKAMTDAESRSRGVGPDCWSRVLDAVVEINGGGAA